jgi:glycosyltransferase involved in cell wall biosynthesis
MRIVLLTTEAFGGHGGIAQYNRDLLTAFCTMPDVKEVVAIPRNARPSGEVLPAKLQHPQAVADGKVRFAVRAIRAARGQFDLVICGHINLLPVAALINGKVRAPLVLLAYGIDVWRAHNSLLVRKLVERVNAVWSISEITKNKMMSWTGLRADRFSILPNAIDLDRYSPGPKDTSLAKRYGVSDRKVVLMLGRLSSSERYKGVDEVLAVMPRLICQDSSVVFLVAGDGDDRERLQQKANDLGLSNHVVFTGFVPETEKIAHLRLADAFVMPSRGEGFGFVFLEALACGVPVVASKVDGSREAVRDGMLGRVVDPDDQRELEHAILDVLKAPRGVPAGLSYFAFPAFQGRVARAMHCILGQ